MANTNLDKASKNYQKKMYCYTVKGSTFDTDCSAQQNIIDIDEAFKAGANWQYQQPINESQFGRYVVDELSAAGYFMADCDQELMKQNNPDWKPYSSKSFGEMLLDFACQYNMEHEGKNYEYKLKED